MKKNSKGDEPKKDDPSGAVDRVVAEGSVLITGERVNEKTGEKTLYSGKAEKMEYVAATDEVILTGWPQIQQGDNKMVAYKENAFIKLSRTGNGQMRSYGCKTLVVSDNKKNRER